MKFYRMIAMTLVLPIAAACGPREAEVTGDGLPAPNVALEVTDVAGTYTLLAYGADELPILLEENEIKNCRVEILNGTLGLLADGRFELVYTEREVCTGEIETEQERVSGTWMIHDGMLHFDEGEDTEVSEGTDVFDFGMGRLEGALLKISPEAVQGPRYTVFRRL